MTLQDGLDPTTVALLIGFGTLVYAFAHTGALRGLYIFFSGFIWLATALFIIPEYGAEWVILFVAFGLLVLIEGARIISLGDTSTGGE